MEAYVLLRTRRTHLWHQSKMTVIKSHWPLPLHRINNNTD